MLDSQPRGKTWYAWNSVIMLGMEKAWTVSDDTLRRRQYLRLVIFSPLQAKPPCALRDCVFVFDNCVFAICQKNMKQCSLEQAEVYQMEAVSRQTYTLKTKLIAQKVMGDVIMPPSNIWNTKIKEVKRHPR